MLTPAERNEFRDGHRSPEIDQGRCSPSTSGATRRWVDGCIAGKHYLHINHEGWVEPCIFAHFATHNVNRCTLEEAFASPIFPEIRRRQPFNHNLLMPCMLIDNPTSRERSWS